MTLSMTLLPADMTVSPRMAGSIRETGCLVVAAVGIAVRGRGVVPGLAVAAGVRVGVGVAVGSGVGVAVKVVDAVAVKVRTPELE